MKEESQKNFIQNYQKALNNYSNTIKLYAYNIQVIDGIEKIISGYKESVLLFQKKLSQIKKSVIKPLLEEGQKNFEFSVYNKYLRYMDDIFNINIESLTKIINEISTKIFNENDKKIYNYNKNILNVFLNNKNTFQNKKISIEKIFYEYDSDYETFKNDLSSVENEVQKYYFNIRTKRKKDQKLEKFNQLVSEANRVQDRFMKTHLKFQENNKDYFQFYLKIMKEIENDIIQKRNFADKNINSFLLILQNQIDSLVNAIKERDKEEHEEKNEEKNNDYFLLSEKKLEKITFNYEKKKYKISSIKTNFLVDYLSPQIENTFKSLNEELDFDTDDVKVPTINLNEKDIYNVVKFFIGLSLYVDSSEYNINLEKHKVEVLKLAEKLLLFGFKTKNAKEFQDVLPIKEEEVVSLQNYIQKNKIFIITFLHIINKYRTLGIFEMPNKEFEIIGNIFKLILDITLKEKTEEDYRIINLIIVLSQTFYINKDGKKYYISEQLKGHNIFSNLDFLLKYINFFINEEIEKSVSKSKIAVTEKRKQEIVFGTILPFCNFLKEMEISKDELNKIIEGLAHDYNLNDEFKNNINIIIGS